MFVATNLTDLHAEPSFLSEMLTQVTNGVELRILEEREKWCRVRQLDGYEGWVYRPYLTTTSPPAATHMVEFTAALWAQPQEGATLSDVVSSLPLGTSVRVVEERQDGWMRVRLAGNMIAEGWMDRLFPLSRLPLEPTEARDQIVGAAYGLFGTYYLWGGCTDWGIDCSGLAQLAHRLAGYTIPRDARLQFPAGREVTEPYLPGDLLYFYAENTKRIGHVGISTGGWKMIHASRGRNGVYEEDVQQNENLKSTFAGARTFLPLIP
jgi:hypothetical protein